MYLFALMEQRVAKTVAEAIEALGGTKAVADLLGRRPQAVSNWRSQGFPANSYLALTKALKKAGWTAPASLWGMKDADAAEGDVRPSEPQPPTAGGTPTKRKAA